MPTPPPPAVFVDDEKGGWSAAPKWTRQGGYKARRSARVFTSDPQAVLLAPNLPAPLSVYSTDYPMLVCSAITPEHLGGSHYRVHCDYEIASWSAGAPSDPPPPEMPPETSYTDFESSQDTITMFAALDSSGQPILNGASPINSGEGMPAYAGKTDIVVTRYYKAGESPDVNFFASLDRYPKKTNKSQLVLPPVRGSSIRYSVLPRTMLYMGFKLGVTQSGLAVATHRFWWSEDHDYLDPIQDAEGKVLAQQVRLRYPPAEMAPLWPQ